MNRNSAPRAQSESNGQAATAEVTITSVTVAMDCRGALYWPEERVLVIADLHLEKGSSFARRGVLLPPYDTAESLARIAGVIARFAPRVVIALGDSFHDKKGSARIASADRSALVELQRGRDWIWIVGNHDPVPAAGIGGSFGAALAIGALVFRHEPTGAKGEIAGHLHPVARVGGRGHMVSRRCFASDGTRLIMPAFGAFAGGLNVRHRAFADVFGTSAFTAHLLGEGRLYSLAASRCATD
ncbi:MAG: ligase-associated DNA damage response endonuclease PdeM [Xanthobacteraceae bacterium]